MTYYVVGHYCPTDESREDHPEVGWGVLDDGVRVVACANREQAEHVWLWYPDGVLVED